jgi:hypothetical protein
MKYVQTLLGQNSIVLQQVRCQRGIAELKKGYHLITNILKDKKGEMVAGSHSISNRDYFSQLLNLLHGVNNVLLTAKCSAEPLLRAPSTVEVKMATGS